MDNSGRIDESATQASPTKSGCFKYVLIGFGIGLGIFAGFIALLLLSMAPNIVDRPDAEWLQDVSEQMGEAEDMQKDDATPPAKTDTP